MGYGITSFSLVLGDTNFIKDFTYHAQRHDATVLRSGAQVSGDWCQPNMPGYLSCGPAYGTEEADANLIRMLEVTARIHNMWIQLIPTFTYKSHNECNEQEWREDQEGCQAKNVAYFNEMFDHVNAIVKTGDYKHVVYELFNEIRHSLSSHLKDEDGLVMLQHARANTNLPVGMDFHGEFQGKNPWPGRYPYIWRNDVDYIAFHTRRNPEPSYETMRAAQDKYNYNRVWVDETVCMASTLNINKYNLRGRGTIAMNGYGTEEERWMQVITHLKGINRNNWKPFYHSICLIGTAELCKLPNAIDIRY